MRKKEAAGLANIICGSIIAKAIKDDVIYRFINKYSGGKFIDSDIFDVESIAADMADKMIITGRKKLSS